MHGRSLVLILTVLIGSASCRAADAKPRNDASAAVYGLDKVWSMHLTIEAKEWEKMQPARGRGFRGFGPPPPPQRKPADDGSAKKVRGGFGFEYEYVNGDLEIDGQKFKNVGVRYKGNSSYATSQGRLKRPLKIDLAHHVATQSFHGEKKLTLNTNVMDASAAREVLAYGLYRSLDVPAPRTAYARLTLTVPGKYDKEFVGLYTLIESIDKTFLKNRFGSAKGLLLKPEGVGPLDHLGDKWEPYQQRYKPKTPAKATSMNHLMEFTKLVQKADDKAFKEEINKYLNVDEFLRFLAATVAVSNLDSFIGLNHNYFLYLEPRTNQFVVIPWDLDLSLANFLMMGSLEDMADLSIRQPYMNRNRLIERLFADEKVFAAYKEHLRKLLAKGFSEDSVRKHLATINAAIDPIKKKEKEAVEARHEAAVRGFFGGANRTPDLADFVAKRAASIQGQLDGKRKGTVLANRFGRPGGFGPGQFLAGPIRAAADKNKDGKLSKDEMHAAVKSLFAALDKDHKGELNQDALTDGINKLLPGPGGPGGPGGRPGGPPGGPGAPPGGPGGRPRFGPPGGGLGGMFARTIIAKAGKDGKVNAERLLAAADKLFVEVDKDKDGKLDDKELIDGLNQLMPPGGPPGGGPPGIPGAAPGQRPAAPPAGERGSNREGK
jgi:spore coat protein CotH